MITLDEKDSRPLYFQIYSQIKTQIHEGRLKAGDRLSSKRKLSESLGVSVNTVETAYSQLLSEGFIEARPKRGYFVCQIDELNLGKRDRKTAASEKITKAGPEIKIDFSTEGVDYENFPYNTWVKLMKNCFNEYNPKILRSSPPEGDWEMRKAVAAHIYRSRGVNCGAESVIIGAGVDNLLNVISGLLGKEYMIAMENPVYSEAYAIFRYLGHRLCSIPVDYAGIMADKLPDREKTAVYVTPSHQFPLGITMPAGRRVKLLNWACDGKDRYIIEDDYDSEFRYNSKPIPAVQSIDVNGRVIYLGTFSKTIAPAIRIGYMVLPDSLMEIYNQRFNKFSSAVSMMEQNILTAFINEGHYERHLNRMRKLYGEKRTVLLRELGNIRGIRINGENAGHHLALKLEDGLDEKDMVRLAGLKGVKVYPISQYFTSEVPDKFKSTVLMGYAQLSEGKIIEGVRLLRSAWNI